MAKILISSIGTGPNTKIDGFIRQYRTAKYKIEDEFYTSSFIASVLKDHLDIDEFIIIGTVKSMWEAVYDNFCQDKKIETDEDYYLDLAEAGENANSQTPLEAIDLTKLEEILGDRSRCITIHYGLNEVEIQKNFDRIFEIVEILEPGDEIYIDITHSFRSLSLFLFLVITFIEGVASERNIKVRGVYYGMIDVIGELGYAPVVNLQSLFEITQWIKGGHSFKSFGNGYLIANLLEEKGEQQVAQLITKISDTINLNRLPELRQDAIRLSNKLRSLQTDTPLQYLQPELERFAKKFAKTDIPNSQLQLELASWYFQNRRYATGYIALVESIITYVCEFQNYENITNYHNREMAKDFLKSRENTPLGKLYFRQVNPIRQTIAHATLDEKQPRINTAIDNAGVYLSEAKRIFGSKGLG